MKKNILSGLCIAALVLVPAACSDGEGDGSRTMVYYKVNIGPLTNPNGTIEAYPEGGEEGTEILLIVSYTNGYRLKPGTLKCGGKILEPVDKYGETDVYFEFILPAEDVTVTAEFEQVYFESDIIGTWIFEPWRDKITFYEDNTFIMEREPRGGRQDIWKGIWKAVPYNLVEWWGYTEFWGYDFAFVKIFRIDTLTSGQTIDDLPDIERPTDWDAFVGFGPPCCIRFDSSSSLMMNLFTDDMFDYYDRVE